MEKIIQTAQELCRVLRETIAVTKRKGEDADKKIAFAGERQQLLDKREADLNARNTEIKKVESVVALADSAKKTMEDNRVERGKLEKFKEQNIKDKAANAQDRVTIKNDQTYIKIQNDGITKTRKALDKEKEEYKTQIIEELKSKV